MRSLSASERIPLQVMRGLVPRIYPLGRPDRVVQRWVVPRHEAAGDKQSGR
jgi:hypothetical protein